MRQRGVQRAFDFHLTEAKQARLVNTPLKNREQKGENGGEEQTRALETVKQVRNLEGEKGGGGEHTKAN